MKLLDGKELAEFVKERQAKQVRALRQSWHIVPKLVIFQANDDPVISQYVRLKQRYGDDIGVEVDLRVVPQQQLHGAIESANRDDGVHGIIVQLPLEDPSQTDEIVTAVTPSKDVDALGQSPDFDAATPTAINWLLAGYNIDLAHKQVGIVGAGRLVGAPLIAMWRSSGMTLHIFERGDDLKPLVDCDIIVTATGQPGLIGNELVANGAVVVDAGTATDDGEIVGDVADEVRSRSDVTITPVKGGVGPLTVAALFDNVITAARRVADKSGQKDLENTTASA